MTYEVQFSLDATAELMQLVSSHGNSRVAFAALELLRERLQLDPETAGTEIAEGLYVIEQSPLRAYFTIETEANLVVISDFRLT